MSADNSAMPLATPQHVQHSAMWIAPGLAFPKLCLACAMTRLQSSASATDHGSSALLRRKIIQELAALLSSTDSAAYSIFRSDTRAQQHLSSIVIGEFCHVLKYSRSEVLYLLNGFSQNCWRGVPLRSREDVSKVSAARGDREIAIALLTYARSTAVLDEYGAHAATCPRSAAPGGRKG